MLGEQAGQVRCHECAGELLAENPFDATQGLFYRHAIAEVICTHIIPCLGLHMFVLAGAFSLLRV